jgi:hypothetical protein
MIVIADRLTCDQPYCTTLATMLGFGSVMFTKVDRQAGFIILCRWAYCHAGVDRVIEGKGVNEREALFDAAEQKPIHEVVKDPILAR